MADDAKSIDTATAAALIDVTPRRLQQLVGEGYVKSAGRGRWSLVNVVQGYIRSLRDANKRAAARADEDEMRALKLREKRRVVEEAERLLIPTEAAVDALEKIVGHVRAEVTSLPARMTRDPALKRELEGHANEILAGLAKRLGEAGESLRAGGVDPDPDAEDAAG